MTTEQITTKESEIVNRAVALNKGDYCGCAKFFTEEDKETIEELHYRNMINSCLCYGEPYEIFDEKKGQWGKYGLDYSDKLGTEKAFAIWKQQKEFFEAHARVKKGVHTDCDGCTYNYLTWVDDVLPMSDFGKEHYINKNGEELSFTNFDIAQNIYGTEIDMARHTNFQDESGKWINDWKEHSYRRLKPLWDDADENWRYLMKIVCQRNELEFPDWMK